MDPMKRKIWIKTYGCQMNMRDSDTLKALLEIDGYTIVAHEKDADIALLNTCSIRDMSENKALGKAGRLLRRKKTQPHFRVGVLGCMASRQREQLLKKLPQLDWIIPPQNLSEVPHWIRKTLEEESETCTVLTPPAHFEFRCYEASLRAKPTLFVPIQQGCNMCCTYCIVPQTRGDQQNRPMNSILHEIRQAAQQGCREVTLLGQIVNAYMDPHTGENFCQLLKAVQEIEGIERIRFVSPHPAFFSQSLIQCFATLSKLCPAVHLPIQSGSDRVLRDMHRAYTREKILRIVQQLREIHPLLSLSTDLIVGYPGETEDDFEQTYQLFECLKFDMAYIFKYSPRPGTLAAPQQIGALGVDTRTKELRNQRLLERLTHYSTLYNQQFLQTTQNVLVEGHAHRGECKLFGRNAYNKKIIFEGPASFIGTFQPVFIQKATSSVLEGVHQP